MIKNLVSTLCAKDEDSKARRKETLEGVYAILFILLSTVAIVITIAWWDWK